jgi:hypothetical protein
MGKLDPEDVREHIIAEEVKYYTSSEGFLDFVRVLCGTVEQLQMLSFNHMVATARI